MCVWKHAGWRPKIRSVIYVIHQICISHNSMSTLCMLSKPPCCKLHSCNLLMCLAYQVKYSPVNNRCGTQEFSGRKTINAFLHLSFFFLKKKKIRFPDYILLNNNLLQFQLQVFWVKLWTYTNDTYAHLLLNNLCSVRLESICEWMNKF